MGTELIERIETKTCYQTRGEVIGMPQIDEFLLKLAIYMGVTSLLVAVGHLSQWSRLTMILLIVLAAAPYLLILLLVLLYRFAPEPPPEFDSCEAWMRFTERKRVKAQRLGIEFDEDAPEVEAEWVLYEQRLEERFNRMRDHRMRFAKTSKARLRAG